MRPEPATANTPTDGDATVIDLASIIGPVRALLSFYDELLAGSDPPIAQLDAAVARIRNIPAVPGRLGRDILLIANGGDTSDRTEIVGALERLRQIAAMDPDPVTAAPAMNGDRTKRPRPKPRNRPLQDPLPGMSQ